MSSVPSWDPRESYHPPPTPQQTPSCSTQESRLYRTKNTVISARSSVTGTPRSSAPSPLHPHPAGCVVLCCTASFSAIVHRARRQSVWLSRVVLENILGTALLAGCRAPGGFQGVPQARYASRRLSRDPGFRPKHLLSSPLHPETRALDLTSWGLRLNALSVIPVAAVSACPFSPCPQPVLSFPPRAASWFGCCCFALGLPCRIRRPADDLILFT